VEISSRELGGVAILEPRGRLTLGAGDRALREAVREAYDAGSKNLLVDLGGVSVIDSSGLGELVAAQMTASQRGGRVKLLHLSPKVQDVLKVAQLIKVFEVFDDEDDAVASFR